MPNKRSIRRINCKFDVHKSEKKTVIRQMPEKSKNCEHEMKIKSNYEIQGIVQYINVFYIDRNFMKRTENI